MTTPPEWTDYLADKAAEQGWVVTETDYEPDPDRTDGAGRPYGDRPFELQKLDERGLFSSDDEAHAFVLTKAAAGEATALSALAFLKAQSHDEYAAILRDADPAVRLAVQAQLS